MLNQTIPAVKGTRDVLPQESYKWRFVEEKLLDTARCFGFQEIRLPVFEYTELFQRGVGDTTDVVNKEMYTFMDKGGRSLTLRPEGTAGVVRSLMENGLYNEALPFKCSYIASCYRYERPQAGRLREFHQFGIECFGSALPTADAEVISLARMALQNVGVEKLTLFINSIGCPDCRADYNRELQAYFAAHEAKLCDTCKDRLQRNPMRILDCKCPECAALGKNAPLILESLCEPCGRHFDEVKRLLKLMNIPYKVNPRIVRGLDYYTRTVFEFVSDQIGAQGTVCGGGRYDGLVSELGGPELPALGFAMGLERLLMVMEATEVETPAPKGCEIYIAPMNREALERAVQLVRRLREEGFAAESDLCGRSLKAQMKYAGKLRARFCMVIGEDELAAGQAVLKDMQTGEGRQAPLDERFVQVVYDAVVEDTYEQIADSLEQFLP